MKPSQAAHPATRPPIQKPRPRTHPTGRMRIQLTHALVAILIIALIISIGLPALQRARQPSGRVPCASNIRTVGQALLLYSMEHDGRYPQKLDQLLSAGISKEVLSCAVTHQPTIFIAPGAIERELTADQIVAYEPLSAHDNEGSYILFGDGHVEWQTREGLNIGLAHTATRAATRTTAGNQ